MSSDLRADVLGLIDQMRAAASCAGQIQYISDQMEVLVRTGLESSPTELVPGVHFTKKEGRIFARLRHNTNQLVTKAQLMDAMYFDHIGDEPEPKIIDVLVHRLRRKLEDTKYQIENVWGQGFRLTERG